MDELEESVVSVATKTKFPPCCLQILDGKFVLVGTYELDKPTGMRTGTIDVFDDKLTLLKQIDTYGAVLDLKLSPFDSNLMLTAHSTGNLMLWQIDTSVDDTIELQLVANLQVFDGEDLITSAHFSPLDPSLVCCTGNNGELTVVSIASEQKVAKFSGSVVRDYFEDIVQLKDKKMLSVQGQEVSVIDRTNVVKTFHELHGLECWTAEWGQLPPLENVIFSGGDDAAIMGHDLRSQEVIWQNARIHDAGVVAIKCSTTNFRHSKPTSILTGSYDDHIRTMDLRMLGDSLYPGTAPALKIEKLNLGGGVWRFIEAPQGRDTLLVCCMYNGAKVVEMSDSHAGYFHTTHFLKTGHDSMCYGGAAAAAYHVTCSFYDRSLQRWTL